MVNVTKSDTTAALVKASTDAVLFFVTKSTKLIYISFWFETN